MRQDVPPAPLSVLPVKFFGGLLAIGSGLALGREGPSVQMGAIVAHLTGTLAKRKWPDARSLIAAGAGAGLAAAFNAPTAGAVFVLEELVRRFEPRMAIAALAASTGAIFVSRMLYGDAPDFHVDPLAFASAATIPLYVALGAVAGLLAVGYNRAILGAIAAANDLRRWPLELRAGAIGAAVGALAWFAPDLVGGGDPLTQRALNGGGTLAVLPLILLLRFGLGGYRMRRARRAACSRRSWSSARSSDYASACCAAWRFPGSTSRRKGLRWWGWRPSLRAWCAPR